MSRYSTDQAYYSKGYESSISKTHSWRNVENSCAYVIRLLKSTDRILDVGCGPGTITSDLAKYVPSGSVIGIEPTEELIREALKHRYSTGARNVDFKVASAYKLPFEDNSFDIVHSHQVLIHLEDPVLALKEMRRVVKPTGFVCCKDADIEATIVHPLEYEDTIRYYFSQKPKVTSTDPHMGRSLRERALEAGFKSRHIQSSASTWCISSDSDRKWFSEMFIDRIQKSSETLIKDDEAENKRKKAEIIDAWNQFIHDDKGWLLFVHGEIICQKELA